MEWETSSVSLVVQLMFICRSRNDSSNLIQGQRSSFSLDMKMKSRDTGYGIQYPRRLSAEMWCSIRNTCWTRSRMKNLQQVSYRNTQLRRSLMKRQKKLKRLEMIILQIPIISLEKGESANQCSDFGLMTWLPLSWLLVVDIQLAIRMLFNLKIMNGRRDGVFT